VCLDRIYLNGYVPNLQVGGQVVTFLTRHLGYPIPSPALFDKIGSRFRRDMTRFAESTGVPVIRFAKGERKAEVMAPYLRLRQPAEPRRWSRSGWRRSSSGCSPAMTARTPRG
jgi:hypothetical protein